MDTVTYPDDRVAHFIEQNFIPLRIKIREEPRLAADFGVRWTPNVVLADADGRVHERLEGYLPPEDFLANLALALGKYELDMQQFDRAEHHFEEVAQRHHGTDAAAEALYWLAVARYKGSHDVGRLKEGWQHLTREHPNSEWA